MLLINRSNSENVKLIFKTKLIARTSLRDKRENVDRVSRYNSENVDRIQNRTEA